MARSLAQPTASTFAERVESSALVAALTTGAITAIWALLFVRPATLPIVGSPNSVASQTLYIGALVSLVVTALAWWRSSAQRDLLRPGARTRDVRWSIVPVTLGSVIVTVLTTLLVMQWMSQVFAGVQLNRASYTLVLAVVMAVVAYVDYVWLSHLQTEGLLYLALFALYASLLLAGARHENPYWWEYSFSHLGMTPSNSRSIFNIGLVLTGALVLAWHQFFIERVTVLVDAGLVTAKARRLLRIALITVAICIALVGIVRFGIAFIFNLVHDVAAGGMGVVIGLIMISLPWLMPIYQRIFYVTTYVIVGLMLLVAALKVFGLVNLTGLEMYEFILAGLWLALFMRNTDAISDRVQAARSLLPTGGRATAQSSGKRRK